MPLKLNPAKLNRKNAQKLYEFFEAQAKIGVKVWKRGQRYQFADNSVFSFAYNVVRRERKEGKSGYRYEFISDRLIGEGAFGKVYENQGTLEITSNNFKFNQHGYTNKHGESRTRVTKIQTHDEDEYPIDKVEEEYKTSPYHLRMKAPTIVDDTSYLVMKELDGINLDDIVRFFDLPFALLVEITKKTLRAAKNQVTDLNKIHRDFKPANILVSLELPIIVNIVDYAFAIDFDYDHPDPAGSYGYFPPEFYNGRPYTAKMDVFSLGRALLWLWNINEESWDDYEEDSGFYSTSLDTLFTGIQGMNDDQKNIIRLTFESMLRYNDEQRITLDEAIENFDQLDYEGKEYYAAINKLEEQGPVGNALIDTIKRLEKGRNNNWNPYWMNCSKKIDCIINAINDTDDISEAIKNEDSELYKAVNMQRILPITLFGKCAYNKAKSLIAVEQRTPSL